MYIPARMRSELTSCHVKLATPLALIMGSQSKKILLWTVPRSVSTAFEFAMRNLPNAKVFHEPYSIPYYNENPLEVLNKVTKDLKLQSYEEVGTMLRDEYEGKDIIFAKNHACTVRGRFEMFLEEEYKDFIHTFLIRDPLYAVASSYRGFSNYEAWSQVYQHGNLGYYDLRDLYNFVKKNIHPDPVVIDANDLLEHPEQTLKVYCREVGIDYREGMTKWETGSMRTQEFLDQKGGRNLYWISRAIESTGISKSVAHSDAAELLNTFPEQVVKCIEEYRVVYNEIFKYRLPIV